jgi:hypothetical protein
MLIRYAGDLSGTPTMPAKTKRSPRVSRRSLTIAEKPAILRAALLGAGRSENVSVRDAGKNKNS